MSANEETLRPASPSPMMDEQTFAAKIKAKHPEYAGMEDTELSRRVVEKYPEYQSSVRLSTPAPAPAGGQVEVPFQSLATPPMDETQFAAKIRAKHPGVYDSLDDGELSRRVLNKFPEYRPHVRLSDSALKPTVSSTVNDTADFSNETGPIENYQPLGFKAKDESDLSNMQRAATTFKQMAGALVQPRATSPNLVGKPFMVSIPSADGERPSDEEVDAAMLQGLGQQAVEVNRRYQNETGSPIVHHTFSDEEIGRGYDPQTKTFNLKFNPTQKVLAVIDAYGRGGLQAAHDELTGMYEADRAAYEKQVKEVETAKEVTRRLGLNPDDLESGSGPVLKGLARAGLTATRLVNNVSGLVRDPAATSEDAEYIDNASASIPREKSAIGRVVEGVTELGATAPQYMMAGPYGAGVVAYTGSLQRGQEAAIKEGLKIGAAGGVAHGTGIAVENLSPVARQVIARHMAGMTNLGLDKLSGSEKSAVESYLQGALLPVGKRGKENVGPTVDYVHDTLGNLKRVPDQEGIGSGWVRVMTDDGEMGVVRAPNTEGQGGVRRADGSLPQPTRRVGERVLDLVNVPRAVQTSYDVSAIGRQGLVLSVLHPVKAAKAFKQSIPTLFSEEASDKVLNDIHSSPFAPLRRESGLYLSDYHHSETSLTKGEEGFQSSVAQSIPGVRASERAYVTFLDKMRADTFDGYARSHPDATPETLKGIASFINKATGRGDLGKWGEKHAAALSQAFYSPRFQLSRAQLLTTPFKGTPEARVYAAKNLVQFVGSGVAMIGLAKAAGLEVGTNPLSSDFGKIKIGDTRVDLWGGFSQGARYTTQLMMGQAKSLGDDKTRPRSPLTTAINFLRTKLAPQISVPLDTALGSDVQGNPATLSNLPKRAFMPLAWRDIEEAVKDDLASGGSGARGAAAGSLSLLGAGVNTITPKTETDRVSEEAKRLKADPENRGLEDEALTHNARVNIETGRLMKFVDESDLNAAQKDTARHFINSRFFYARVQPGDTRKLESVERVFSERMKGIDEAVRKKIKELISPVSLANPKDGRLPPEYYRSNNLHALKLAARQSILNRPENLRAQIHPAVQAAYGNDLNQIYQALSDGTIPPGAASANPLHGLSVEREMAAATDYTERKAAEFDHAIDSTSRDIDAQPVAFPQFERAFDQYQSDLQSARSDEDRMLKEQQFNHFLKGVRLVSDPA